MNEDKIYSKSWIYKLINKINGKIYVGSTINLIKRMSKYKNCIKNNRNLKIENAVRKYGWYNFTQEIIEVLENKSLKELLDKESYYIKLYNSTDQTIEYNIAIRSNSRAGIPCSEEQKKKLSKYFSGKNHPYYGKNRNKETKNKISKALKGKCYRPTQSVKQINITTNQIINIFPSIKSAAEFVNGNHSLIVRVCQNKKKTAYGFKWQYN